MTKDSYLIFEAYKNHLKVLNELAPVELSGEYGGTGEEIGVEFPELSKGKYDLSPEETKQVFYAFLTKFRSLGGKSPKLYKDFYETELAPVIRSVKSSINNTNAKYTSRVLYNALKEANVVSDERDGISGVKLDKKPSQKGIEALAKFTLKNAGDLGAPDDSDSSDVESSDKGQGIDDPVMRGVWLRILGEGEYSRQELQRMFIDAVPDMEESEAKMNVSSLISTGYLKKVGPDMFEAVDPEEKSEAGQEEGEGTGEVTSGVDVEDIEDIDDDQWGGVYTGPRRGEGGMD